MKISFFEEFPDEISLYKLKYVNWDAKIFVASKSLDEFRNLSRKYNHHDFVFWPVLDMVDGYWISPFSRKNALNRLYYDLWNKSVPLMLDLELPRKRRLLLTQLINSFSNNKIIDDLMLNYRGELYTAEYLFEPWFMRFMYKNPVKYKNKVIKMLYSSMHNYNESFLEKKIKEMVNKYNSSLVVGLGTLSSGILGNEPKLMPELLDRDLNICSNAGVSEVVIFRLGGLDNDYLKVIKKYI